MYEIRFAEGVKQDLRALRAYDRNTILDEIEGQLSHEPTKASRNRKLLAGLIPPWDAPEPVWELRVGEFRVFYDVNHEQKKVVVQAVRRKPAGKQTEEIL